MPRDYKPDKPPPLVLALYPGGSRTIYCGTTFMRQVVLPGLSDLQAVVVAPDCPARSWTDSTADRAVLALLVKIRQEYAIDPRRILVTGFSRGDEAPGFMAARHDDLFTAAIRWRHRLGKNRSTGWALFLPLDDRRDLLVRSRKDHL